MRLPSLADVFLGVRFLFGAKLPFGVSKVRSQGPALILPHFGYGIPFAFLRIALSRHSSVSAVTYRQGFGVMEVEFDLNGLTYVFSSDDWGGGMIRGLDPDADLAPMRDALLKSGRFFERDVPVQPTRANL